MELSENWDNEASVSQKDNVEAEKKDENSLIRLIPGYADFDDYLQDAFDAMRAGIKAANNLPIGDNFDYYACFPSFNDARHKDMKRMLASMQSIIKTAGNSGNIHTRDIDEKFDLILEANDQLLDQANILMDEESGILRNPQVELVVSQIPKPVVNGTWNIKTIHTDQVSGSSEKVRLLGGKNVQRPQLMFKDKIDNSLKPWMPRIKEKPNALKPLALYVEEGEHSEVFNHPYEFELDRFETPECQLKKRIPIKYNSLDDTKFVFIDKPADVKILLEDLRNHKEIAVDLEHHSYRTFQGITCLMQISTTKTDYLIDTLILRSELHQLNEIFTKPSILKVFHGADMDIVWLQRDLSLYVVNMFDTHQAAKQLNLPYLSLAYLLNKYCGVDPNKHFQLADWRIRPLPLELMKYAREDTHYLLYIKDMLKNELINAANGKSNILKAIYDQSTEICKRTYTKPIWTEESCMNMYRKSQKSFNNKQMYALMELHRWRDFTAREEDDSIGYVLPNHMLLNIAETLPREMQGVLACCNPIPPLVRQNLLKLHKIVLKAREQSLVKSVPEQDIRQRSTQQNHAVDTGVSLYIPHDVPSGTEARADLPCLLNKNIVPGHLEVNKHRMLKHTITIFDTPVTSEDEETKGRKKEDKKKTIFISPFMRYKCVIPMVIDQEAKEREEQQKKEETEKEEESLTKKIEQNINEAEINESKNRIYEHFKQVSQQNIQAEIPSKKKKKFIHKLPGLVRSQIHATKRKKEFDIGNESQKKDDFSTPTSYLNVGTVHVSKKAKQQTQEVFEERRVQESTQVQSNNNSQTIDSIRARKKGDKKANEKLLKEQGMLPSEKFDYKSVDFTSFQGGSTQNSANQTQFQQPRRKKKEKHFQKWKKQKLK